MLDREIQNGFEPQQAVIQDTGQEYREKVNSGGLLLSEKCEPIQSDAIKWGQLKNGHFSWAYKATPY